jgi:protein phosphatase
VASAIAVNAIRDHSAAGNGGKDASVLKGIVEQANATIIAEAQGDKRGMGTTLTAALVEGSNLHIAHVGDSRAYMLRGGQLYLITDDHSWVAEEVQQGRITAAEAEHHPRRNLLTRALGAAATVKVDAQTLPLEDGDLLLLCSDGLYGVVPNEAIKAELVKATDLNAAPARLIDLANQGGGPDNITVVLGRFGGPRGISAAATLEARCRRSRLRRDGARWQRF